MSVECLYTGEEFAVIATGNEDLCVGANGSLEDGERAGREFVFFKLGNLIFAAKSVSG